MPFQPYGSRNLTGTEKAVKWLNHSTGSDRGFGRGVFLNEEGAGRLEDMAIRAFVRGRRGLGMGANEREGLGDLEWGIGRKVLGVLVKNNLLSVAVWKHFATAYSDEYPWTGDFYTPSPITETDVLFDLIPEAIGSPGGLFLTNLTLVSEERRRADPGFHRDTFHVEESSMELSRAQWMQITTLDNLAILELHGSFCDSLVDHVVRAWAHRAVFDGAFSRLRALGLINQYSLTSASLLELAKIKSLVVVKWSGTAIAIGKSIGDYGWKPAENEHCFNTVQDDLKRPLLKIRCGPKTTPGTTPTAIFVRDPKWKATRKRQSDDQDINTSRPAPSKRPNMRKGAKKDAAALLNQFSGI
ncbi:cbs domain-containing protein [Venturia nashicola]|nr:cbs domain-containing protein [Venturia nashicola]